MAKTIEEICKDINEWQKENPNERSAFFILGHENNDILIKTIGSKCDVVTCVASSIADCAEIRELITLALELGNKHKKEE